MVPVEKENVIPNLKVYNVSVRFPDPYNAWLMTIPVRDVLTAKGFVEAYKKEHLEVERRHNREIATLFNIKRLPKGSKGRVAFIKHSGYGKYVSLTVIMVVMPTALYSAAQKTKYKLYNWLKENSVVIRNRPENFYLMGSKKIRLFMAEKHKVDREINKINEYAFTLWEEEIKEILKELIDKYNLLNGYNRNNFKLNIKPLHPVGTIITPIYFGPHTISPLLQEDPETYRIVKESFNEYLKKILEDVHTRMKPVIEGLAEGRTVRVNLAVAKLEKSVKLLKDLELDTIAEQVREQYLNIIRHPSEIKQMKWENVVKEINARVLSL